MAQVKVVKHLDVHSWEKSSYLVTPILSLTNSLLMDWQYLGLGLEDNLAQPLVQVSFEIELPVHFRVQPSKLNHAIGFSEESSVSLGHTA